MIQDRDIALIEELRAQPDESAWLEFKRDNDDSEIFDKCYALKP